jgi:hypothetical protein
MKRGVLLLALTVIPVSAAPAQQIGEAEAKDGFVAMFNGRDFAGWQFGGGYSLPEPLPKNWSVEGGLIKLSGGGSPHLGSQWDYDDFDVRFEWRALKDNYNSGFFIRSGRKVGNNQINLAKKAAGTLMQGAKGGKGVPELQNPPGQWNEWRVRAVGDKVTFWCNGKQAWEVTGFKTPRGYIGLQAEGAAMDFRNLRIKEIGWETLNGLDRWDKGDKGSWKAQDDALASEGPGRLVAAGRLPKEYVLRLEWKCGPKGVGRVGWNGAEAKDAVLVGAGGGSGAQPDQGRKAKKATDNPQGQWNYLELRVAADKVSVWQNGEVVFEGASPRLGAPALWCDEGPVAFRNIRLKALTR